MNRNRWLHGLVAAFVGGAAGAIDSGITLLIVAPDTFNLNKGLLKLLLAVGILAVLTGAKVAAAYLKQSPVPPEWNGAERRGPTI